MDRVRIRQVFANLLDNAMKYTGPKARSRSRSPANLGTPWPRSETPAWAFRPMNKKKSGTAYIEAIKAALSGALASG